MSAKSFFDLMDEAAEHLAKQVAKAGGGDGTMALDDAADAFKALVGYTTLKYKFREEDPDENESSFSGFRKRLEEAHTNGGGTPTIHRRGRRPATA